MVSRWKLDGDVKDAWGNNHGKNNNITFLPESQCVSGQWEGNGTAVM